MQGVGFRYFAQRVARRLGMSGYVKNLPDGRVEVYAIGPEATLTELRAELESGPRFATVSDVAEEDAPVDNEFASGFSVERDMW